MKTATEVLRDLEWSSGYGQCPKCNSVWTKGHYLGCELGLALGRACERDPAPPQDAERSTPQGLVLRHRSAPPKAADDHAQTDLFGGAA